MIYSQSLFPFFTSSYFASIANYSIAICMYILEGFFAQIENVKNKSLSLSESIRRSVPRSVQEMTV